MTPDTPQLTATSFAADRDTRLLRSAGPVFLAAVTLWSCLCSGFLIMNPPDTHRGTFWLGLLWAVGLGACATAWKLYAVRIRTIHTGFRALLLSSSVPMLAFRTDELTAWAEGLRIPHFSDYTDFFRDRPHLRDGVLNHLVLKAVNPAALALLGACSIADLNIHRARLFNGSSIDQCCSAILKAARSVQPGQLPISLRTLPDGQSRFVIASWIILPPAIFGYSLLHVSLLDLTEQHFAYAALKTSEARLECTMRTVPVGVVIISCERIISSVNETFCQMLGYASEDLVSFSTRVLYLNNDEFERIGTLLFHNTFSGLRSTTCGVLKRKDGSPCDVIISASLLDPNNPEKGAIAAVQDSTELRKNERSRQKLTAEIEQAQRMESTGRIIAGLAHDYQSILLAMRMQLDALRLREGTSQEDAATFAALASECQRGILLSKRMLSFGKKDSPVFEEVNLQNLVKGLLPILRRLAGEKVDIRFDAINEDILINGDCVMLDQVFLNLVSNARDAMPQGGTLNISLSKGRLAETGEKLWALLEVSDTGSGIPPENINRIFDPFFTTKSKETSFGLGLMIVEDITQSHGGSIKVSSHHGEGTQVRLRIPILQS